MTATASTEVEARIADLVGSMTPAEKVGQLVQLDASHGYPPDYLGDALRAGGVGAILNTADREVVHELQRIACEESRLGIPLLVGRDVIHGFHSILPIPLGQAATWNPALVEAGARAAACEAAAVGINWTFAPMIDVTREPRWGRIAESPGEDPYLAGCMAAAIVRGFQTDDPSQPTAIAACAKHFAAYGAVEAGRDYSSTHVPPNELRNVYLPPFKAAVEAGALTLMTSFSEIDGVPCTAHRGLLCDVLRDEWGFDGLVVSDWDSVSQLTVHGLTEGDRDAAASALAAGVDMEMAGQCFATHVPSLIEQGDISTATLDTAVANVLRAKFRLGLFEAPYARGSTPAAPGPARALARELATQSLVLLRNEHATLPLQREALDSVAVLGPLAHAPYQQLGTWIFDGDPALSVTVRDALVDALGDGVDVHYERVFEHSRDRATERIEHACRLAANADAAIVVLGEESILSGEAHSRADIGLPGAQAALVKALRNTSTPLVGVVIAGRPLTLADVVDDFDALLYAWHPGIEAGPAVADVLLGRVSPSGKLPVSFPSVVGQVPIYYNHKNTGKPPVDGQTAHIDALDTRAPQTSLGMSAYHLDAGFEPLYPFGYGLSYGAFEYRDLALSSPTLRPNERLTVRVTVANGGAMDADEIVQLYLRDPVASATRPVRELKAFRRVTIRRGEAREVTFELGAGELGFYGGDGTWRVEPGEFHLWVGGSGEADLFARFRYESSA